MAASDITAIVPAAGSGQRLGADLPKALVQVAGRPLLAHAVAALTRHPRVTRVIVAAPADMVAEVAGVLAGNESGAAIAVVPGGADRSASVRAALARVDTDCRHVLVHDAARPFVPLDMIDRVVSALDGGALAVVPVLPVTDTIKTVDATGTVTHTPDRDTLRAVQTPQGFDVGTLRAAHTAPDATATDDAALVERLGVPVVTVPGDPAALKVTVPADLARVEALAPDSAAVPELSAPLVGFGVDVHRFGSAPPLWLGGLCWTDETGLEGHSDADVACHAVADAMLAAAGLGDLGSVFGTADPHWAGASGAAILAETARRVAAAGLRVGNVSVQVIGNRPRVGTRRAEAEAAMSAAAGGPVRLSATTTDGLGLTGRGEGLAAMATCLLLPRTR